MYSTFSVLLMKVGCNNFVIDSFHILNQYAKGVCFVLITIIANTLVKCEAQEQPKNYVGSSCMK